MKTKDYTKDYILGDTHAEWGKLSQFINKKLPRAIFVCGD